MAMVKVIEKSLVESLEDYYVPTEKRVINVVLLGKTGSGKSATGNSLLGREAFKLSNKVASETKTGTVESSEFEDFILNVVDMPGINDTNVSLEETLEEIYDAMSLCPEGFDALVYVLPFPLKITEEEAKVLEILKRIFGDSFTTEFCIVVMAKGDTFVIDNEERGEEFTFDIWLKEQKEPKHFRLFIEEIKSKVVLFFNRGTHFQENRQASVDKFMAMIKSKQKRYKNEDFKKLAKERDKILIECKLPAQKAYVQKQLSLIQQDIEKTNSVLSSGSKKINAQDYTKIEKLTMNIEQRLKQLKEQLQKDNKDTLVMNDLIDEVDIFLKVIEHIKKQPMEKKSENFQELSSKVAVLKNQQPPQKWTDTLQKATAIAAASIVGFLSLPISLPCGTFKSMYNYGKDVYEKITKKD